MTKIYITRKKKKDKLLPEDLCCYDQPPSKDVHYWYCRTANGWYKLYQTAFYRAQIDGSIKHLYPDHKARIWQTWDPYACSWERQWV